MMKSGKVTAQGMFEESQYGFFQISLIAQSVK